jgi:DNA-binding transcriptional MocR family regulator
MTGSFIGAAPLAQLLGDWQSGRAAAGSQALADRIRLLVLDGRVGVDVRLPAERVLADRLEVSRTLVAAAYGRLRVSGHAISVRGSGTRTRLPAVPGSPAVRSRAAGLDLRHATVPASSLVPDAATAAAAALPRYLATSGYDPIGLPELRAAVAERYRARGLPTDPDQILITIGAQHAIALLARVLLTRGDRVLIEQPSYPHAQDAVRFGGGRLVGAPVDSHDGWDLDALEQAVRRTDPALAYLMPDFHNPTGATLPADGRDRVLAAAHRAGTTVVIDETTAELDIDRGPMPPMAGPDTVLIGSLGKTIWGGLRIGWIRARPDLIRRLAHGRGPGDLGTPILEQLVALALVPRTDEVLQVRREQLRATRDALLPALRARFPDWSVPDVHGGIFLWINLGQPVSSALAVTARSCGLVLTPGSRYGIDGAFERFLRIPLTLPADGMPGLVDALGRAWDAVDRLVPIDPGADLV